MVAYPVALDGRCFVVRGSRWRRSDPSVPGDPSAVPLGKPMQARRAASVALRHEDEVGIARGRAAVNRTKLAHGERPGLAARRGA